MEEQPPQPGEPRRPAQSPLRRLRSLIPTSPLPWRWHVRINRGLLAGILVLAAGGALASILVQRSGGGEDAAGPRLEAAPEVRRALAAMSPAQKAEAVLAAGVTEPASATSLVRKAQLGAVVIGPAAWSAGGPALLARLRREGGAEDRVAPLIVALQEGGSYRAYPDLPPARRQLDVGLTGDPAGAQAWSTESAAALKRAGFDLNLGPVADVATLDSPVADRAFSDDPELAAALAAAAVRGCRRAGLVCAVKHFPGLGAASDDTAVSPATVGLDDASLASRDLLPFRAAFEAGANATVLSLAFYAAYDPVTPAALSPAVATGLLRERLGFEGLAISDDLSSGAITAGVGAPDAAVQALAAGTDLVLVTDPAQARAARAAISAAARDGSLSPARLDEAAARVLELKRRLGLLRPR